MHRNAARTTDNSKVMTIKNCSKRRKLLTFNE